MRLRTLSEAECYARCYGSRGEERVSYARASGRRERARKSRGSSCGSSSSARSTSASPGGRRRDALLRELDVAAPVRAPAERSPEPAAAQLVGLHGDVGRGVCHAASRVAAAASDVPDVLAPDLACVFCGINPGRVSAAAAAHFANPRNDFWRLLHDAGFTPRLYDPSEQFALLELGFGVTNAAYRTTPGSGDLRRGDFDAARLEALAYELRPRALAFVGKEAYRGAFGERPELGPQIRELGETALFVLPSTSPANAAVPYEERLRWFRALREWIEPRERQAVRGLVIDAEQRVLLFRWENPAGAWWITPGGGP